MNCRRRGSPKVGSSKRKDPEGQNAKEVFKGGDKHGMEYRPVVRKPYWEQKADVIPSEK